MNYEWYIYQITFVVGIPLGLQYLKDRGVLAKLHCKRWR